MDTRLNFLSRSPASRDSVIVLFQKNARSVPGSSEIAWKTIRHCGFGYSHPVAFPASLEICTGDAYGNYSPRIRVADGDHFSVVPTHLGGKLAFRRRSPGRDGVEVCNDLRRGAVDLNVFRDSRLLWRRRSLPPQQRTVFSFPPSLWIGAIAGARQGEPLDPHAAGAPSTLLSLRGVASADIVMTGGGAGPDAAPITFSLENAKMV
jgi:hypothetical protein